MLRIDDLDGARKRRAFVEDIFKTLEWLKLDYDKGPTTAAELENKWSQVHRKELYMHLLNTLNESGKLYSCSCSRRVQSVNGDCCDHKNLPAHAAYVSWKVAIPAAHKVFVESPLKGYSKKVAIQDFVVLRKDKLPAYQIASVADDLHFGINFVVRGEDLLSSTASQLYLAQLAGKTAFQQAHFLHHPLLNDGFGKKLSKSKGAAALKSWRDQGIGPEHLYQLAAHMLKLETSAPVTSLQQLLEAFQPNQLKELQPVRL